MRFKLVENRMLETNISTIWKRIQDTSTFAIIGSQDKDTKEDRRDELIDKVKSLSFKYRGRIEYKYLFGAYEYEDGSIAEELSIIIFNISFDEALKICRELNQESIIWKDENYFGFIDSNGNKDGEFSKSAAINFSDEDIKLFGSRLATHKRKNQLKPFKFVMEQYKSSEKSSIRNMTKHDREKEKVFVIDFKEI